MIQRRFALPCFLLAIGLATVAEAGEPTKKGSLEFVDPWARASAPQQRNGAAFVTIRNIGTDADRIVAAKAGVSRKVELHTHVVDAQGVARMREIPAIELPANSTVELRPGGMHVMFIDLERPLQTGTRFPLTLVLEKAGEVTLDVEVRAGSGAAPMRHGADHGSHGKSN